jgi:hypothetical protein
MTFLSPATFYHSDGMASNQMHVTSIPLNPVKKFSNVIPEHI